MHGTSKQERKLSTPTIIHPVRQTPESSFDTVIASQLPLVPPRVPCETQPPPTAEVKYPFGVQNDLGSVTLNPTAKVNFLSVDGTRGQLNKITVLCHKIVEHFLILLTDSR
jgi:hypothetical protein